MLRPWSQQARQLTPRRGTVAHLRNQGCCVHIHTENLSTPNPLRVHVQANSLVYRVAPTALRLVVNKDRVGEELGIRYGDESERDVFCEGECDEVH